MAYLLTCDACDRTVASDADVVRHRFRVEDQPAGVADLYSQPTLLGFCGDCMAAFEQWRADRKGKLDWRPPIEAAR